MDRTQVGILEKTDEVGLGSLLKGKDRSGLESQVRLEVLGDLSHKSLEGSFRMRRSVDFWYFLISRRATVPGLYLCGFFTPPVAGADLRAALVASCLRGAFPPVDFLAVCLVRAILNLLIDFCKVS